MKKFIVQALGGFFVVASLIGSAEAAGMAEINTCYQQAGDDLVKLGACLQKEFDAVQAEHKNAVERVTVVAKAWDKPNRNRNRWDRLMRANQAFENYVRRECDFVENTTKGSRQAEKNAEQACRINLYRMRTDMLENRYLSAEKK